MEQLIHYVWKHKFFPLSPLTTTDGKRVEIVDTGLPNKDAGPDFFQCKSENRWHALGGQC